MLRFESPAEKMFHTHQTSSQRGVETNDGKIYPRNPYTNYVSQYYLGEKACLACGCRNPADHILFKDCPNKDKVEFKQIFFRELHCLTLQSSSRCTVEPRQWSKSTMGVGSSIAGVPQFQSEPNPLSCANTNFEEDRWTFLGTIGLLSTRWVGLMSCSHLFFPAMALSIPRDPVSSTSAITRSGVSQKEKNTKAR